MSNTLKDAYENDVNSETPEDLVKIINEDAVWFDRLIGVTSKIAIYKKDMNPIQTFLLITASNLKPFFSSSELLEIEISIYI